MLGLLHDNCPKKHGYQNLYGNSWQNIIQLFDKDYRVATLYSGIIMLSLKLKGLF